MRAGLLVGTILTVVFVAVLGVSTVVVVVNGEQERQASGVNNVACDAAVGPTQPGDPGSGVAQAQKLDDDQKGIVSLIISIGKQRNMSPRAWQVAIQAGMTESKLRNLTHGDRDSLGIFQMRPSMGWGSVAQVTDPPYQINKFFDVLEGVPGWENRRPGEAAQAVERSGFPGRYHSWEQMAVHLVENLGQITDVGGCGEGVGAALPPNQAAAASIQFALREQGKPYVWGATGPSSYDCSGLMLRAYESAGIILPRVSRQQYTAGAMLPVEQAQPGDLLFWGYDSADPSTIHHVAMYLGDGKMVEAQQTGVPVHIRNVSWDEDELVRQAVRPGV